MPSAAVRCPTVEISCLPVATGHILPRPPVTSLVFPMPGMRCRAEKWHPTMNPSVEDGFRHGRCLVQELLEKYSRLVRRSVNSAHRSAKTAQGNRGLFFQRGGGNRIWFGSHRGLNHGAARNGYRKRTRVRVACGVTIRPCGVGILSSHGHIGRSVGGWFGSFVVLQPHSEALLRREHLSSGPGLPTAALTGSHVGFVRMSAPADSIERATRHLSAVVNRAASVPAQPVGMSGGWTRRTRPDPRMRLRTV